MPRKSALCLWAFLLVIVNFQKAVFCRTSEFGGYVSGSVILTKLDSPYEIRKDVIIESGSSLSIRPGVELRFAPGIGITVMKEAVLEARGEIDDKIIFTRLLDRQFTWTDSDERLPDWPDVRLVDGHSILEGRLQMLYKGRWRSVCTNSKKTAKLDHVADNWVSQEAICITGIPNNDSSQMMYRSSLFGQ
ncbi:protein bark beetle [Nephila pilipes]|uniref:Protein bark beetle n=1 Tax=Nephila pilipes TaxID=299642 RepID=A0A8X6M8G1_NEPPI|nr:protein bark beetle [Nephila pilipes]